MSDKIKFFSLGGLDENGKNMSIIEINNDIYVFDAGIKFPDKRVPGVDCIIPNYNYLKENSYYIKKLNRNKNEFENFSNFVKDKYGLRVTDKISKTIDNIDLISTLLSTLK